MASIRISSPSASAALLLVDLLADHGAAANQEPDGRWHVSVSLTGAHRSVVPQTLAVARAWLVECGLDATSVTLDGHTHLLRGDKPPSRAAMH